MSTYRDKVVRRWAYKPLPPDRDRLRNAALGLARELLELERALDNDAVLAEAGDCLYYAEALACFLDQPPIDRFRARACLTSVKLTTSDIAFELLGAAERMPRIDEAEWARNMVEVLDLHEQAIGIVYAAASWCGVSIDELQTANDNKLSQREAAYEFSPN